MKFLSIYKTAERSTPPTEQEMATMGKLVEQGFKEGWLLATEGCLPSKLGARDRRPLHRSERGGRRIRDPQSRLEGRSDPTREGLSEGRR
jgi:hypothetical protein